MGYVEDLFNSIQKPEDVERFVEEERWEDVHLEFTHAPNGLDQGARRKLARALSGFANSDGGVLIWGVIAGKREDDVDVACDLKPIKDLPKFISCLNSHTGQAVSPFVDGVDHKLIRVDNKTGYAKTIVPRSDTGPHMAKSGEYRYYKRSGDSFYKMEHFEIEDMFGRRPKPVLSLFTKMGRGSVPEGMDARTVAAAVITVGVENSGRGIARFVSLWLRPEPTFGVDRWKYDWSEYRSSSISLGFKSSHVRPKGEHEGVCFGADPALAIHPDSRCPVTDLMVTLPKGIMDMSDLEIEYQISAEGMRPVEGTLTVEGMKVVLTAWPNENKKL